MQSITVRAENKRGSTHKFSYVFDEIQEDSVIKQHVNNFFKELVVQGFVINPRATIVTEQHPITF